MSRHVLVPVDGSPLSERALRHALQEFPDADVTAYHVVDLFEPEYGTRDDFDSVYEPMLGSEEWHRFVTEETDRLFERIDEIAADDDRSVTTDSDIGQPARLIVEYATEEDVDHVVVGSHGRLDADRPLFGSVAETVARRSPVPVTVLR